MGKSTIDTTSEAFVARLASLLRTARNDRGESVRAVARRSRGTVSARKLRAIEAAELGLDDVDLPVVAGLYGVDLLALLQDRVPMEVDAASGVLATAGIVRRFTPGDEDQLLTAYLLLVRELRDIPHDPTVALRREDVEMLASHLRKDATAVLSRLGELMGATVTQRRSMVAAFAAGAALIVLTTSAIALEPGTYQPPADADHDGEVVSALTLSSEEVLEFTADGLDLPPTGGTSAGEGSDGEVVGSDDGSDPGNDGGDAAPEGPGGDGSPDEGSGDDLSGDGGSGDGGSSGDAPGGDALGGDGSGDDALGGGVPTDETSSGDDGAGESGGGGTGGAGAPDDDGQSSGGGDDPADGGSGSDEAPGGGGGQGNAGGQGGSDTPSTPGNSGGAGGSGEIGQPGSSGNEHAGGGTGAQQGTGNPDSPGGQGGSGDPDGPEQPDGGTAGSGDEGSPGNSEHADGSDGVGEPGSSGNDNAGGGGNSGRNK